MLDGTTIFIAVVFVLAGVVKGVIGLGLPTISMGLLALVMTPLQAAAILVVPSFLTNVWQMVAGPALGSLVRRLWPMQIGVCFGTWCGAGWMAGNTARYGSALLGVALVIYAVVGLRSWKLTVARPHEFWLGPLVGAITGLITAATGAFVIPSVPYLQTLALDKEEFVQALGLSFTVSTIALTVNLALAGALNVGMATPTLIALIMACVGMTIGQALRLRLSSEIFRRCFFVGLLLLGTYLAVDALR
jgi:hypothetical protein